MPASIGQSCVRVAASVAAVLFVAACAGPAPLAPPPKPPPPVVSWPAPVGVAGPQPKPLQTPDAPFRESPPAPGPSMAWVPPRIQSWSMANGVHVLFVERHELPIVSLRVVSNVGAGDLAGVKPGWVAFMGSMLEQGAGGRTALQVSDDYEAMGATHHAFCDWDGCTTSAKVLASQLTKALDLLCDVVRRPTFAEAEIDRARSRWLASLQQEKSSPRATEANALAAAVFGRAHPYGHSLRGEIADIEKLKHADVTSTWRRVFEPTTTTVVVAGDVTPGALRTLLEERFGTWAGTATVRAPIARAPALGKGAARVVLVDAPGAAQSEVYLAAEGAPFATADRTALGVMNLVLGGMFSSRINLELREARAYTYGAHSGFSMRHGAGPFVAGGAIFAEHTADAVRALEAQVARIRDQEVTAAELDDAKEHAKLALPARFETVDDVTGALAELALYGLPLDEYASRSAKIDAVTAADVQRVARRWLHPETMRVVVTGDRAKLEGDLSAWGPIERLDAYGDPVR